MDKLMKEFMDEATTRQTQVGRPLKEGFDTDESLVAELVQWTENDGQVYEQRATPVMKNMMRKLVKGKYDHQLAVKAWMYVVEDGARSYSKEFGEGRKGEWATFFPKNIRLAAAKEMADSFLDEVKAGGYSPEDFDVKGEVQLPGAKQEGKKRKLSEESYEERYGRMGATDPYLLQNLELFMENDHDLYSGQQNSIMTNLMRKMVKGTYDHELAKKLWLYLVDAGAQKYTKEVTDWESGEKYTQKWNDKFPKSQRLLVASVLADDFRDSVENEEYTPESLGVKGEVQLPGAKQEGKKAGKRKISKRISEAKRRRMKENASRSDVDSYLETALWSSTGDDDEPLDKNFSIGDFSAEARALAEKECSEFYAKAESLLTDNDPDHWPHDFWLTRNGHGTGFWDGDYENGDELTEIAEQFYESDIYVGDNGEVELSSPSRKTERKHR